MGKRGVSFVLFGGTGDLTKRKLVPAISEMMHNGILGKNSVIIGISRKDMSNEEYRKFLLSGVRNKDQEKHIKKADIRYFQGDFSKKEGLEGLSEFLRKAEGKQGNDRIFYLSTGYEFFGKIVSSLKKQRLSKQGKGYTRIVFEKPFGNDLKSSNLLDRTIHRVFDERDVFRIDHYLAKETVQNLSVLKFTNPLFYSTMNSKYVESIEVVIDENLSVGNRLGYYDKAGAIKDMIQNHLLQVLALLLMDRPSKFNAKEIHDEKVSVLRSLVFKGDKENLLGQYKSYAKELKDKGMKKSKTETFAKIILECKKERWKGTKLVLRTGKMLERKYGQIKIKLRHFEEDFNFAKGATQNEIIIDIYPKQDVTIKMNTRDPRSAEVREARFDFCRDCLFGPNSLDEYATLIGDVIKGEKTLFTRSDELKESWKIIDKIERKKKKIKFVYYPDCENPEEK